MTSTERRAVVEAAMKSGAKNAYVVKEPSSRPSAQVFLFKKRLDI